MNLDVRIGQKIKNLRNQNGLTQEELASRTELTKGFISQLERGQTAPSVSTLADIVECLGTNLSEFFRNTDDTQIIYKREDCFEKVDEQGNRITWLIASAQGNNLEPIRMDIQPGEMLPMDKPHEGEEFGYVLKGKVEVIYGNQHEVIKQGDSFSFQASKRHTLRNLSNSIASVIWISTPPNF